MTIKNLPLEIFTCHLLPYISGGTKYSPLKKVSTCSVVQPFEEN